MTPVDLRSVFRTQNYASRTPWRRQKSIFLIVFEHIFCTSLYCVLFCTERVTYQELPQNNAKCSKTALLTKWGASRAHFCRPFLIHLLQLFVENLVIFETVMQKKGRVHVFRAAFGRALAGGFHPPDPPICSFLR